MTHKLKKSLLLGFIILLCCSVSVSWFGGKRSAKLTITGSTTLLPMAQACAEYYMKNVNKKAKITVNGGGSGVGVAALIDGRTDIADASRQMKDKEMANAKEKGVTPVEFLVAYDAITIIVNPNIPLDELSKEDVKKIFTGEVKNWNEIGGPDATIVVVSRDTSSGTYGDFVKMALKKEKVRADAMMLASNQAIVTTVEKTPGSIGYIAYGYVNSGDIKPLKIDGITPSPETGRSGEYVWSRGCYMYTNGKPKGETKKFIDFVLSSRGQKLGESAGLIGIK